VIICFKADLAYLEVNKMDYLKTLIWNKPKNI